MRFNCKKKSYRRKMDRIIERHNYLLNWHFHFAWLPVRLNNEKCAWLETVQRRFNEYDPLTCEYLDPEYTGVENLSYQHEERRYEPHECIGGEPNFDEVVDGKETWRYR